VALARSDKEEARRGENGAVEGAEAAARHEKWHHPRRSSQHSASECLKFKITKLWFKKSKYPSLGTSSKNDDCFIEKNTNHSHSI
jgi:hypothetical protein